VTAWHRYMRARLYTYTETGILSRTMLPVIYRVLFAFKVLAAENVAAFINM
jgi:hypothetical protein